MTTEHFEVLDPELKMIIGALIEEWGKATTKHPHWPTDDVIHAAAIVAEESGELIRAALQFEYEGGTYDALRKEAIQTGAIAIRFLRNS